jgi:predicted nucleotidyltransferase
MDTILLPPDFKEFLRLLNSKRVEYLIIGGYAVAHYGYVRATADMDIWIALDPSNAERAAEAIRDFGFNDPELTAMLLLEPGKIIRMGNPPFRLEVMTTISGVEFAECYARRSVSELDGLEIPFISLEDLKANKQASGRLKDLADLEHLS